MLPKTEHPPKNTQRLRLISAPCLVLLSLCGIGLWSCSENNTQGESGTQTHADSQGSTNEDSGATSTAAPDTTENPPDVTEGDTSPEDATSCDGVEPCEVNMEIGDQRFQCTLSQSQETQRVWHCVEEGNQAESEWVCTLESASAEEASWVCESRDTDGLLLGWKCIDPKRTEGNGETNWTCNPDIVCSPSVVPAIGEWTPAFVFHGDACNECSYDVSHFADCRHLYVGRADAIEGNTVDLSFEKTMNGGPPSVVVRYWVLAVPLANPTCQPFENLALADLEVRAEGLWTPDERILSVQDVPIWATQEAFDTALPGDQIHFFLITGGRDAPELPTWITKDALTFTKIDQCD